MRRLLPAAAMTVPTRSRDTYFTLIFVFFRC